MACAAAVAGCDVTVARDLSGPEATRLRNDLNRRGVAATAVTLGGPRGRYALEVGSDSVATAVEVLADRGQGPWTDDRGATAADSDRPWVATKRDEQARLAQRLAGELARSLELLPGVARARVHLSLPVTSDLCPGDTPTQAQASVLILREAAAAPVTDAARALIHGAVPHLPASAIGIVERTRPAQVPGCAPLAHIGPIVVTRASAGVLKHWLGVSLALHMLLASVLLILLRRQRQRARSDD